jgi:hypothetical protein
LKYLRREVMAKSTENQPSADSATIKKSVLPDAAAEAAKAQPVAANERELSEEELDKASGGHIGFLNPQPLPPG